MYPQRALTGLAARKAALQCDIMLSRAHCAGATARIAQPLAWLDRALALWRQLSPLAPLACLALRGLAMRRASPRARFTRSVLRWSPIVFAAARSLWLARSQPTPRRTHDRVRLPGR